MVLVWPLGKIKSYALRTEFLERDGSHVHLFIFDFESTKHLYETIDPLEKMEMSLTGGAKTEVATRINEIDSIWNITTVID